MILASQMGPYRKKLENSVGYIFSNDMSINALKQPYTKSKIVKEQFSVYREWDCDVTDRKSAIFGG